MMRAWALAGVVVALLFGPGCSGPANPGGPGQRPADPTLSIASGPDTQTADEAERLCRRFMKLKNAKDPKANDLLAAAPTVPSQPVSELEADRLDAEFMLRDVFTIRDVRRDTSAVSKEPNPAVRFILVTDGTVGSKPMRVKTATGTSEHFRGTVISPDIIVVVKSGKIHGVQARLHREP